MKKLLLSMAIIGAGTVVQAMNPGLYQQKMSDGSTDNLVIAREGVISLEMARQVGGPGGFSDESVVPYPTVCRVKQWGTVVFEDSQTIHYQVKYVYLTDQVGLRDTENCGKYVDEFNGRALSGKVVFSLLKSEYTFKK